MDDINGCARERVRRDRQTRVRAARLEEAEHHDEGENGHRVADLQDLPGKGSHVIEDLVQFILVLCLADAYVYSYFFLTFGYFLANFDRLVLGCIEADFASRYSCEIS